MGQVQRRTPPCAEVMDAAAAATQSRRQHRRRARAQSRSERSERRVYRCGEANKQFVDIVSITIQYKLNVLIEIASRLLFRFAKMDEADWVTFPLRLAFSPSIWPKFRACEAELVGWFGHWRSPSCRFVQNGRCGDGSCRATAKRYCRAASTLGLCQRTRRRTSRPAPRPCA